MNNPKLTLPGAKS